MGGGNPELSVVIPAYNEANNIEAVVGSVGSYLRSSGIGYEINVVDDGSVDGTAEVLAGLRLEDGSVRMLRHRANRGYGAALRTGFAASRGRYVLLLDGDGQFRIDALASLWRCRREADLVLGYRNPRRDPPWRRFAGWLYGRLFVRAFFGGGYRDVNCGFKLMAREVLDDPPLSADGALISVELLTRARLRGATWIEVPVPHFPRRHGKATGLLPRVLLAVLRELVKVRRNAFLAGSSRGRRLRPGYDAVESASL